MIDEKKFKYSRHPQEIVSSNKNFLGLNRHCCETKHEGNKMAQQSSVGQLAIFKALNCFVNFIVDRLAIASALRDDEMKTEQTSVRRTRNTYRDMEEKKKSKEIVTIRPWISVSPG